MAAVFDVSNFNLVSRDELAVNKSYHIFDEVLICVGVYQGREEGDDIFIDETGDVVRAPTFLGYIHFYVPKPPPRVRRMDKAS